MCRPLKDKIAEIEAKYNGILLSYDLNERRRVIADFDRDVEYVFMRIENYKEDIKFVLDHKLELAIIRRTTLNLILIIEELCESVLLYRHAIEFYLMDEYKEKNNQLYYRFRVIHGELTDFFSRLNNMNVFGEETPNDDVLNRFRLFDEPNDDEVANVVTQIKINREEIEHMNTAELMICFNYQLFIFQNNLWTLKFTFINRDKEFMEFIYPLNYILYAKTYWPSYCENFRAHIIHQRLRGKVDINSLGRLKDEAIYQFEYNTPTGKIWRDCSENIAQMAIQMKETFIREKKNEDEEMWKFFFQNIFELEEYDRWIEELRNPPESDEDKEKRELLLRSNSIFDMQKMQDKGIDILRLYYFIKEYFIKDNMKAYLWYALRRFLDKLDILHDCTNVDFAEQMKKSEWFKDVPKPCSDNEMNNYNFLNGKHHALWLSAKIPGGSRATKTGLRNIYKVYSELELNESELKR